MTYAEVLENAKKVMAPKCQVCLDCNGKACAGKLPGVGAKGDGSSFTVCREYLKSIKINMDVIHPAYETDASIELFGKTFKYPFFVAPIGGMSFNYTNYINDVEYTEAVVYGAKESGIFAFTGDGPQDEYFTSTLPVLKNAGGLGVSTIKPWKNDKIIHHIKLVEETGAMAFAIDVDSAALVNLKLMGKPVDPKSPEELREIVNSTKLPFIVKGIMTAESAIRCAETGAYGIVISTHGGRVMEDNPATASKIQEIRQAVGDKLKIFVDGGIRSGADVFKCIALGADAVLIGRPYAIAAHGGREEGVKLYTQKIAAELTETMMMSNCKSLKDINLTKIIL